MLRTISNIELNREQIILILEALNDQSVSKSLVYKSSEEHEQFVKQQPIRKQLISNFETWKLMTSDEKDNPGDHGIVTASTIKYTVQSANKTTERHHTQTFHWIGQLPEQEAKILLITNYHPEKELEDIRIHKITMNLPDK